MQRKGHQFQVMQNGGWTKNGVQLLETGADQSGVVAVVGKWDFYLSCSISRQTDPQW